MHPFSPGKRKQALGGLAVVVVNAEQVPEIGDFVLRDRRVRRHRSVHVGNARGVVNHFVEAVQLGLINKRLRRKREPSLCVYSESGFNQKQLVESSFNQKSILTMCTMMVLIVFLSKYQRLHLPLDEVFD